MKRESGPLPGRARDVLALIACACSLALIGIFSPAAGAACPNEDLRIAQGAASLPDCRAYEMVSPSFKAYLDISQSSSRTRTAPDGDAVTFGSIGAFAGAVGAPDVITYMAERGSAGWATRALSPVQKTEQGLGVAASDFFDFTPDLSMSAMRTGDPAPVDGAPAKVMNLFVRDNVLDEYATVTLSAPPGATQSSVPLYPAYVAASDDFSHVLFSATASYLPEAPADETPKLYEWVEGDLHLVGLLDNGLPPAEGAIPGRIVNFFGLWQGGSFGARSTMSADGSHVYFVAPLSQFDDRGRIYLRLNNQDTVQVNESELATPAEPQPATFWKASRDGSKALLTTQEKLLDGDPEAASDDLYMFTESSDPENDANLSLLSADNEPADGIGASGVGVVEASDALDYVYFTATGQLVAGADISPGRKLYLWHDGDLSFIGTAGPLGFPDDRSVRREAYVTSDGHSLLFSSNLEDEGPQQVYLYSADTDTLQCLSCATGAATTPAFLWAQATTGVDGREFAYHPRNLTADGSAAFFNTAAPLDPKDSNGRVDVYKWEDDGSADGKLSLVSTGGSTAGSFFADATPDGSDAFFVTRERLVGWDVDLNADLYDARVGGGFPEPPPPTPGCEGEACQWQSSAPLPPSIGSRVFHGPAKRKPRRCVRKKASHKKASRSGAAHRKAGARKCRRGRR